MDRLTVNAPAAVVALLTLPASSWSTRNTGDPTRPGTGILGYRAALIIVKNYISVTCFLRFIAYITDLIRSNLEF